MHLPMKTANSTVPIIAMPTSGITIVSTATGEELDNGGGELGEIANPKIKQS